MPGFQHRLPNMLSLLRIGLAAALLPAALMRGRTLFLALLLSALATDALDGFLARRLGAASDLGRRLDSYGDYVLVLALVPGLILLWPALMRREAPWLMLALGAYFAPTAWSLVCRRRVPALHTWSSKHLAVAMSVALPLALLGGSAIPLRVVCGLQLLVAAEEVAILRRMPGYSGQVATLRHARRLDG
jgi:phosphatidylglycerophosphate synthase